MTITTPDIPCHMLDRPMYDDSRGTAAKCDVESEYLQRKFDELVAEERELKRLFYSIQNSGAKCVIFGGWGRDLLLAKRLKRTFAPRDLDIVIDGITDEEFELILPKGARPNIFGGFSIGTALIHLDIWKLERTYLIRRLGLPNSFETLPATTVFDINSIAFGPKEFWKEPIILDSGFDTACSTQAIDFRTGVLPFPEIQAARAIIYSAKMQFRIDKEVEAFINEMCRDANAIAQVRIGINSFCQQKIRDGALNLLDCLLVKFNKY